MSNRTRTDLKQPPAAKARALPLDEAAPTTIRVAEFDFEDAAAGDVFRVRLSVRFTPNEEQRLVLDAAANMTATRAKATAGGLALQLDVLAANEALWFAEYGWGRAWRELGLPQETTGAQMIAAVRAVHFRLRDRDQQRRVHGRTRGRSAPGAADRQSEIDAVLCRMARSKVPERSMHAAVRGLVAEKWPHLGEKARDRKENTIRIRVRRWLESSRD